MLHNKIVKIGTIAMFAALLVGCGTSGSNAAATGSSTSGNTANTATTQPVALTGNATKGQTLFTQNCSSCHSTGTDTKVGPGLKGLFSKSALPNGKPVNEKNIEEWITTGGGPMPSFPQLSDSDKADLAAYIKTLSS